MRMMFKSFCWFILLLGACLSVLAHGDHSTHSVVTLPKQWTLLVIKRTNCPHCSHWVSEVYDQWGDLGLNKMAAKSSIKVVDGEVDNDVEWLVDMVNAEKLYGDIDAVPSFVLLNSKGYEKEACRFVGYSSYDDFKKNLKNTIISCKKNQLRPNVKPEKKIDE